MKAVLISIQPKWCEAIASGRKTVEVRKTKPKIEVPFKVYIYETKDKAFENIGINSWKRDGTPYNYIHNGGKVTGEFVCDNIAKGTSQLGSCLSMQKISKYANGKEIYGWHISDLVIYDKPKELSEFNHCGVNYHFNPPITRPPQSWCYVEELKGE